MKSSDDTKMVYAFISDFTVSSFLHQLTSFGDVSFNLHVLPEMADFLRAGCEKWETCVGHFADLPDIELDSGEQTTKYIKWPPLQLLTLFNYLTGRLVLDMRAAPNVRFVDGAAEILLKTSVDIR